MLCIPIKYEYSDGIWVFWCLLTLSFHPRWTHDEGNRPHKICLTFDCKIIAFIFTAGKWLIKTVFNVIAFYSYAILLHMSFLHWFFFSSILLYGLRTKTRSRQNARVCVFRWLSTWSYHLRNRLRSVYSYAVVIWDVRSPKWKTVSAV